MTTFIEEYWLPLAIGIVAALYVLLRILFPELFKPAVDPQTPPVNPTTPNEGTVYGKIVYSDSTLLNGTTITLKAGGTTTIGTFVMGDTCSSYTYAFHKVPHGAYVLTAHRDLGNGSYLRGDAQVNLKGTVQIIPDLTLERTKSTIKTFF